MLPLDRFGYRGLPTCQVGPAVTFAVPQPSAVGTMGGRDGYSACHGVAPLARVGRPRDGAAGCALGCSCAVAVGHTRSPPGRDPRTAAGAGAGRPATAGGQHLATGVVPRARDAHRRTRGGGLDDAAGGPGQGVHRLYPALRTIRPRGPGAGLRTERPTPGRLCRAGGARGLGPDGCPGTCCQLPDRTGQRRCRRTARSSETRMASRICVSRWTTRAPCPRASGSCRATRRPAERWQRTPRSRPS